MRKTGAAAASGSSIACGDRRRSSRNLLRPMLLLLSCSRFFLSEAFCPATTVPPPPQHRRQQQQQQLPIVVVSSLPASTGWLGGFSSRRTTTTKTARELLRMASTTPGSDEDGGAAAAAASSAVNDEKEGDPSPLKKPEDPQVTALKDEIAELERELKARKRELSGLNDSLDLYSKDGYARRVAEMENMRRARSSLNRSNKSSAIATVVAEFVPALDRLTELRDIHSSSDFAKQYGALAGALRSSLGELGVQDFSVGVGDRVDAAKMEVVNQLQSPDVPQGCVIEVVHNNGLELQGNVVRRAQVVASLGPPQPAAGEEEPADSAPSGAEAGAETSEDGNGIPP